MPNIRIACLQLRAHELEDAPEALDDALAAIDLAADEGAHLVITPEMTFPAYLLRSKQAYRNAAGSEAQVLAAFAARAKRHAITLVVGLGTSEGDSVYNTAVVFDPEGNELGRYRKSFLWHFDRKWFTAGEEYPVIQTPLGKIGILICADSRVPEIARTMALNGADLIVDPTAWVTSGRDAEALYNPQTDYFLPVRAVENGIPIAAADKWGMEAGTIHYVGRSRVVGADGSTRGEAGTEGDACVVADVEIGSRGLPLARRPELYRTLTGATESLPVTRAAGERVSADPTPARIATAQLRDKIGREEFLEEAARLVAAAVAQDTALLLFQDTSAVLDDTAVQALSDISLDAGGIRLGFTYRAELPGGGQARRFVLMSSGSEVYRYDQTHLSQRDVSGGFVAGPELAPVLEMPFGRVAAMIGAEAVVPEVARCLMLQGAEIILWPAAAGGPLYNFARARADENRVFVVLAAPAVEGAGAVVVAPSGVALASAPTGVEFAPGANVVASTARAKEVVPGTHIVNARRPKSYRRLVEV